jgi:hypothetical protein
MKRTGSNIGRHKETLERLRIRFNAGAWERWKSFPMPVFSSNDLPNTGQGIHLPGSVFSSNKPLKPFFDSGMDSRTRCNRKKGREC